MSALEQQKVFLARSLFDSYNARYGQTSEQDTLPTQGMVEGATAGASEPAQVAIASAPLTVSGQEERASLSVALQLGADTQAAVIVAKEAASDANASNLMTAFLEASLEDGVFKHLIYYEMNTALASFGIKALPESMSADQPYSAYVDQVRIFTEYSGVSPDISKILTQRAQGLVAPPGDTKNDGTASPATSPEEQRQQLPGIHARFLGALTEDIRVQERREIPTELLSGPTSSAKATIAQAFSSLANIGMTTQGGHDLNWYVEHGYFGDCVEKDAFPQKFVQAYHQTLNNMGQKIDALQRKD
jgi:hypothetical protein